MVLPFAALRCSLLPVDARCCSVMLVAALCCELLLLCCSVLILLILPIMRRLLILAALADLCWSCWSFKNWGCFVAKSYNTVLFVSRLCSFCTLSKKNEKYALPADSTFYQAMTWVVENFRAFEVNKGIVKPCHRDIDRGHTPGDAEAGLKSGEWRLLRPRDLF